jgi:hypothetical protein
VQYANRSSSETDWEALMTDPDSWLQKIGDDAGFDAPAVDRLMRRIVTQPKPATVALRRTLLVSAACLLVASASGLTVGALVENGRTSPVVALLPAETNGLPSALFDEAG